MKKQNILIISSHLNTLPLAPFWQKLSIHNIYPFFFTCDNSDIKLCQDQKWQYKKYQPRVKTDNFFQTCLFILLLPMLSLFNIIRFFIIKRKNSIYAILCLDNNAKIIYSIIGKIFKIRTYWLMPPEKSHKKPSKLFLNLQKFFSSWSKIITFNSLTKNNLINQKYKPDNIIILPLGIKPDQYQHQDNIFNQIAETKQKQTNKKFFTIGAVIELNTKQNIETIFQAIKKTVNVIPNIQLIIIGDGPERKNLNWLSRRMEIDNMVWFVGRQNILKKWYKSFDIYLAGCSLAGLCDISYLLHAAASALPIICPQDIGFNDIIDKNNGLKFALNDSEDLSQAIIKLNQNKILRKKIGEAALETIQTKYTDYIMAEQFIKLQNNR